MDWSRLHFLRITCAEPDAGSTSTNTGVHMGEVGLKGQGRVTLLMTFSVGCDVVQ